MTARPLKHYVAITPKRNKDNTYSGTSIVMPTFAHRQGQYLSGTVIAVGRDVDAVAPGDVVVYERQSAHPGQTGKIDAETFGGNPGDDAFLVPCYPRALPSVASIDEEIDLRNRSISDLRQASSYEELSKEDRERFARQSYHIEQLKRKRTQCARGSKEDGALAKSKGRGIVAVLGG